MASRCRSLTKPALSLFKSTICKPTLKPTCSPSLLTPRSSVTPTRSFSQLGSLQSMLPLHMAVSSARLTSCLGMDSRSSRSMCQGDTVGILRQIAVSRIELHSALLDR